MHQIVLQPGAAFHTHRGALAHDDLIGAPEGSVVTATSGTQYVALRRAPATEYLLVEDSGQVYGVLATRDLDQVLAGV